MHSPDIAGAWDDLSENLLHFYFRFRLYALLILFVFYFAFTGFERYEYLKRIAELEKQLDYVNYPVYIDGVKVGLKFKKNQQGGVP